MLYELHTIVIKCCFPWWMIPVFIRVTIVCQGFEDRRSKAVKACCFPDKY